jgi:RNA polymerase subunit RPABC4/transcription elongation factor Spt4
MDQYILILAIIIIAILLLWFGYFLFFRKGDTSGGRNSPKSQSLRPRELGSPGEAQTCPVCSAKLEEGEQVKSVAFPPQNGGTDRFMHIKGCRYCLEGERRQNRVCPVCGNILTENEVLICRLYERQHPFMNKKRAHIHVMGCSRCKLI